MTLQSYGIGNAKFCAVVKVTLSHNFIPILVVMLYYDKWPLLCKCVKRAASCLHVHVWCMLVDNNTWHSVS